MFKALLAASVAMLACCAAAVFAGPIAPQPSVDAPASASPAADQRLPLHLFTPFELDDSRLPEDDLASSFMPIPLSTTDDAGASSLVSDEATPLAAPPAVQAAVIPLPSPFYAAVALLGIALIARRAMLRAC